MERTRHTTCQERYRKKVAEIHKTNAEFMAYAENKAPLLVSDFFAEKTVILTHFYLLPSHIKLKNKNFLYFLFFFFKPDTEARTTATTSP